MRVSAPCIPCYLNQSLNALAKGGVGPEEMEDKLLELFPLIVQLDKACTPAENSSYILHALVERLGGQDPFAMAKHESNRRALELFPKLLERAKRSEDPLKMAIMFSAAGNVVDLGLFTDYDLESAVDQVVSSGFKIDHYDEFQKMLGAADKLMIIGDNSGEIVFDRILAEILKTAGRHEIIYGVKGSFILNDATYQDAAESGIIDVCRVVANGNNFLGTIEEKCSSDFLREMEKADLIISKGQANYESLENTSLAGDKTFFLLKAKCSVVAENLGVSYGDMVFVKNYLR